MKEHRPVGIMMSLDRDGHPTYPARVKCSCGWTSESMTSDEQAALVFSGHVYLRSISRCGVEGCRLPPDHEGLHAFGRNIP